MQRAGTAFYMAPEMINAGIYDQKADAWMEGCDVRLNQTRSLGPSST